VGVNEIMSCVYCSTEGTTDTRFVLVYIYKK